MANDYFQLEAGTNKELKFLSMDGTEEVSRMFDYSVLAMAKPTDSVVFSDLLGKPAKVTVAPPGGTTRYYHGLISACSFEGSVGANLAYRLTVRPWLWLLTRSSNVRVFQKLSVPDILKKVFDAHGGQVSFKLSGSFRKREYCVQYRESDFNFVSRLMEEEGIFYFFKHAAASHTLVVGNTQGVFESMQGVAKLPFRDATGAYEAVRRWRWSEQIQSTKFTVRDHSFLAPSETHERAGTVARTHAQQAGLQAYDYPAGLPPYPDESAVGSLPGEAENIARRRIEELQARFALADGESNSTNVCAGARLMLTDHPIAAQNVEHVVLSTRISMRAAGHEAGASADAEHRCSFTALVAATPFRPARVTPKPVVAGPQTATVVGPAGEEIFVDKHGRVKLHFHWDRDSKKNADSSCYVRVAQPAAGKGWGMVFLPRIGQEVVVDFLEGDPDQPIVTGRVYNAENMPPYKLPDKKTVSTIKSRSTTGGGAADFNEIRFEDLKGSEYVLFHAQKDKLEVVEASAMSLVGADQHQTVKKDRKEKIEGEHHLQVVKDVKHKFDAKYSLKVGKDILLETAAKHNLKAAEDITSQSGTAYSIKAGTDLHVKAGQNVAVDGGMNVHLKGGMNVVIEAGMQLTLKAGGASVVLGPDGVSITGAMVKINSGGAAGSGSGASPVAPAAPDAPTDPQEPQDPLTHS